MKQEFIEALLDIGELRQVVFGSPVDVSNPDSESDAVIAMGKLSYNINQFILKPLAGLDLTELVLRVGQRNPSTVLSLLSNLELIDAGQGVAVEVLSPVETEQYFVATGIPVRLKSADILSAEAWYDDNHQVKYVLQRTGDTGDEWSETVDTSDLVVAPEIDIVYVTLHVSYMLRGKDAPLLLNVTLPMLPGGQGGN